MDKSVLRKALADTEEPTPGYLFRDIAKMTFVDGATQDKLVAYLFDKLDAKNSVHVLSKTLNVVKHLCKEGHADFQKTMQRRSDDLKMFATYRGPTDPKYGDKLNEKVRTMAKEAIDAAFSHRRDANVTVGAGVGNIAEMKKEAAEQKSGGFVAKTVSSVAGFVTGGKIDTPSDTTKFGQSGTCAPMPTQNKWAEAQAKQQGGGGGGGAGGGSFGFVDTMKEKAKTGFGMWDQGVQSKEERMMAELHAGPGGFQAVDLPGQFSGSKAAQSGGGGGGDWKFASEGSASGGGGAGAPGAPGQPQKKVQTLVEREVEKLATMKSTPQRVELSQFLAAVSGIVGAPNSAHSWEELATAMDAMLGGKVPWQQRLNTLCGVEYLLKVDSDEAGVDTAEFKQYFLENPEDVQRNVVVVQTALKERAQKVLKVLGVPDRSTQAAPAAVAKATAASVSAGGASALQQTNMDGTSNWSASLATTAEERSASSDAGGGGGGGMLDGMVVKGGGGGGRAGGGGGGGAILSERRSTTNNTSNVVAKQTTWQNKKRSIISGDSRHGA